MRDCRDEESSFSETKSLHTLPWGTRSMIYFEKWPGLHLICWQEQPWWRWQQATKNGKRKEKKLQEAMPPRSKFCHVGSSTKATKIIDYPSSFIVIGPHCPTQYSFIHGKECLGWHSGSFNHAPFGAGSSIPRHARKYGFLRYSLSLFTGQSRCMR